MSRKYFSSMKCFFAKRLHLLAAPLVLLLSFAPKTVHAGILGTIADIVTFLPLSLTFLILLLVAKLTGWITALCGLFLNWVTGPAFITLKYTNNEFVNLGLGITKNFVNLILVVFLIYIALSIALRLKERATKQTLVYLIIIALLVNFAPVFCGLIVDASNIVQNYFLAGIQKGVSGIAADIFNKADALAVLKIGSDWTEKLGVFAKMLLIIVMNISVAFAFLLFAAIFFFRLIAIWLLVILSPLAFVAWILPATKKFWTQWWEQFIQWSIIGIPLAFFLYLVMATSSVLINAFHAKMTLPGVEPDISGLLNDMLPYIAITALLYFGFIIGLKTSAMGASSLMSGAKKLYTGGAKKGAKWMGRTALRQTAGRLFASEWGKKLATTRIPTAREGLAVEGGWVKKGLLAGAGGIATVTGARWAARGLQGAGSIYGAQQSGIIENEKKKIKEQFGDDYERAAATADSILPGNFHKKIAMAQYLAETKGKKALGKLSKPQQQEMVALTAKYSPSGLNNLVKHMPELIDDEKMGETVRNKLIPDITKEKSVKSLLSSGIENKQSFREEVATITSRISKTKEGRRKKMSEVQDEAKGLVLQRLAAYAKVVDLLKDTDIPNLSDDTINKEEFKEMVVRFKPNLWRKLGDEIGHEIMAKLQEKAQIPTGEKKIKETASSLPSIKELEGKSSKEIAKYLKFVKSKDW